MATLAALTTGRGIRGAQHTGRPGPAVTPLATITAHARPGRCPVGPEQSAGPADPASPGVTTGPPITTGPTRSHTTTDTTGTTVTAKRAVATQTARPAPTAQPEGRPAGTACPAGTARKARGAGRAGTTARRDRGPGPAGPARTACPARVEPQRPVGATGTASPTGTAGGRSGGRAITAQPAGPAEATQKATATAVPTGTTGTARPRASRPARATLAAITEQPGIAAPPTGLSRRPRPTVTTVTDQQTTRPTGLPGPRRTIGAITDQRTVEQRLGGRINHTQNVLTQRLRRSPGRPQRRGVGRLGSRVHQPTRAQRLHELLLERRHPRTQRLILLPVGAKHRRDRRRHLVSGRGHHRRRRRCGREIGRPNRRPNLGQILGRGGQHIRRSEYERRHLDSHQQGITRAGWDSGQNARDNPETLRMSDSAGTVIPQTGINRFQLAETTRAQLGTRPPQGPTDVDSTRGVAGYHDLRQHPLRSGIIC